MKSFDNENESTIKSEKKKKIKSIHNQLGIKQNLNFSHSSLMH